MDFALTDDQCAIDEGIRRVTARFGDEYWLARDRDGAFPHEFRRAVAEGGWLGVAMPVEHGGSGLGVTEAAVMMHAVTDSAGAMSAASAIHLNIFGPNPIVVAGTEAQKARFLPPLIAGEEICCFGVTEPDAGLDTARIATLARRDHRGYVVDGRKMWTSTAQVADRILLLARTTPRERCRRPTDGLTLFYARLDRTRDGWIGALPYTDRQWAALFEIADRPDLAEDPRFRTLPSRLAHIDEVYATLGELLAGRSTAEWIEAFDAANIPSMPVNSPDDLVDDPHLAATGFWHTVEHPDLGTLRLPGVAARFSKTPGAIRRAPPRLGEHSVELLTELRYGREEAESLVEAGVTTDGSRCD